MHAMVLNILLNLSQKKNTRCQMKSFEGQEINSFQASLKAQYKVAVTVFP